MKKHERLVYLELTKEIAANLCMVCKYGEYESEGCCEGYGYCVHPIEVLSFEDRIINPGDDCWGFCSNMSVHLLAELAGAVLSQGYTEWAFIRYSRNQLTVFGRRFNEGREFSGKVRINYVPKAPENQIPLLNENSGERG